MGASLLVLSCLAPAGASNAHERHKPKPQVPSALNDSAIAPRSDSSIIDADTSGSRLEAIPPFPLPPVREGVLHHPHNKIVHFPIVLSLVSLAGLLWGRRRPEILPFARIVAWAAALSAGGAWIAGLSQAAVFAGEPKAWLVLVHRNWGIATTVGLTLTAALAQWGRTRRRAWMMGFVAVLLLSATAYLGGLLSHG